MLGRFHSAGHPVAGKIAIREVDIQIGKHQYTVVAKGHRPRRHHLWTSSGRKTIQGTLQAIMDIFTESSDSEDDFIEENNLDNEYFVLELILILYVLCNGPQKKRILWTWDQLDQMKINSVIDQFEKRLKLVMKQKEMEKNHRVMKCLPEPFL
uniref:Uncharacterized protein n=1 Tax=Romanomermis culicivorax TaxID=13658 RepID=A0A915JZS2_ROMCU